LVPITSAEVVTMDELPATPEDFTARLTALDAATIARIAADLRADLQTADGEVAWWRATVAVSGALRRERRTRLAGLAAHHAAAAVVAAAQRAGYGEERWSEVTAVARAAAEVARALVAAGDEGVPASVQEPLLHPWHALAAA
jgi:hypothetical protein